MEYFDVVRFDLGPSLIQGQASLARLKIGNISARLRIAYISSSVSYIKPDMKGGGGGGGGLGGVAVRVLAFNL